MARKTKRRKFNPSTGATVAWSIAAVAVGSIAGFVLATHGCNMVFQEIAKDPSRYFPNA